MWRRVRCPPPAYRRTGAGRSAPVALAGWGRERGATRACLQGEVDNRPALNRYRDAGFRPAYEYVYLTNDPPV
jgi:N-acetylglutamate synthase